MIEVKLAKFPLVIPSKQIIIAIRVISIDTMHTITLRIFILLITFNKLCFISSVKRMSFCIASSCLDKFSFILFS